MTNQSELEQILDGMYHAAHTDGLNDVFRPAQKVEQYKKLITANYTPINQPSTNTAPVGGDSSGKQSTNQSEQSAKNAHSFDEQLDAILKPLIGHDDGIEFGNGYHDECRDELNQAKQAIRQLIADEMVEVLDRIESNKEILFWWTGGEYEKTTGVDMRAIEA